MYKYRNEFGLEVVAGEDGGVYLDSISEYIPTNEEITQDRIQRE